MRRCGRMRPAALLLPVLIVWGACAGDAIGPDATDGDPGGDPGTELLPDVPAEDAADVPLDAPADDVADVPPDAGDPGPFAASPVRVEVVASPPLLRVRALDGRVIAESLPGIVRLARVIESFEWNQGFLAVSQDVRQVVDPAAGTAELEAGDDAWRVTLRMPDGTAVARLDLFAEATGVRVLPVALPGAGDVDQVRFRLRCRDGESFYGFGGQNDAVDHRGHVLPIRSTEQGLGKDPDCPEDVLCAGHLHDTYFPLPYTVVATSGDDARAHGILLESTYRSRFLVCAPGDPEALEIQVALASLGGLRVLAGPSPRDVVRQFTDHHARPNPLPDWAFGPWVALFGDPAPVAEQADLLDLHDIPLSTVWHMDFRDYEHPDLPAMIDKIHGMGLRVLTYFNSFLDEGSPLFDQARDAGWMPHREDGSPYWVQWWDIQRSLVDFTDPNGWASMTARLDAAWDLGLDGWMADYAEWVVPDMRFDNGMTGWEYGNLYPVDWARINHAAQARKRPDGDAVVFSRSGYLGSNRYLGVTWAGDQQTDWSLLDGIGSVIPYGTGLGLAGVSAFGHDIAGYTGLISPPSTKELYFRWTQLGAWSPVMRTHRGSSEEQNWDWNRDDETIAHFRGYALLHLRLLPYLAALHAEAVRSGLPAMRSALLEFPAWDGAKAAVHEFLLGPAFFVAPVIEEGAVTRSVRLPPGTWYRFPEGTPVSGDRTVVEDAPLDRIPVFLRAGGVAAMLPDTVRRAEPVPGRPDVPDAATMQAARLEVPVGAGGSGELLLADGTRITVSPDAEAAGAGDLPACGDGQDPWTADCHVADGAWLAVPRSGPGLSKAGGMALSVAGGPPARRYLFRVAGGVAGE